MLQAFHNAYRRWSCGRQFFGSHVCATSLHKFSSVLLHACGQHGLQTTPIGYFTKLFEAKDSGLQQLARAMGVELAQVGKEADAVLTRNLGSLKKEVNGVRSCITPRWSRRARRRAALRAPTRPSSVLFRSISREVSRHSRGCAVV